jgi:hypothetical protein
MPDRYFTTSRLGRAALGFAATYHWKLLPLLSRSKKSIFKKWPALAELAEAKAAKPASSTTATAPRAGLPVLPLFGNGGPVSRYRPTGNRRTYHPLKRN